MFEKVSEFAVSGIKQFVPYPARKLKKKKAKNGI
jgi:hypothetical protein